MKHSILILMFCSVMLGACQRKSLPMNQKPVNEVVKAQASKRISKQIILSLKSLKANDIQENITFSDELLLNYSISVIEGNKIIQTSAAIKKLGKIKQGDEINLDSLHLPAMRLLKNQKLGIQLSLWEIDDYDQISKTLNQVNTFGGILQVPIALAEWSAVSNPLGWFLWGTRAGGMGMYFLSKFDQNDLLGVSELIWDFEEIPNGKVNRFKRGNWKGGKNALDSYDYQFSYHIISVAN
ncbi:hypothetical protein V7S76_09585 [Aquirufa sp. ROCK2-A2]